jgi:hypothetical protein
MECRNSASIGRYATGSYGAGRLTSLAVMLLLLGSTTGCLHSILATGVYLWQGGNVVPAVYDKLEKERVVVICRPPSSNEYRHAGASRMVGKRISKLLGENVKKIDIVSSSEVDNWIDEEDWENFKDLGTAVKATRIVYVELDTFELYKGTTLYQGDAEVKVTVYSKNGHDWEEDWSRNVGQVLFPQHAGIPAADKSVSDFQRQYVEVLSTQVATLFYKHDPNAMFAMDAVANR